MYNLQEYSSNYSEATGSLCFYFKDEAINFDADIANNNNFQSFEYKAKLLENTVAQAAPNEANRILKNTTIAVLLINCKVELKLNWTKYWVLPAAGSDNDKDNNNGNNIIFTIKETK